MILGCSLLPIFITLPPQYDSMPIVAIFRNLSAGSRLVLLVALIIMGAVLSIGIAYLALALIHGKDVLTSGALMTDIGYIRTMQILNQLGIFIMPPLLFALFTESKPCRFLGFTTVKPYHLLATFGVMFAINPVVSQLMEWNEAFRLPESMAGVEQWMRNSEETAAQLVEWMLSYTDVSSVVINVVMIVLLPAVGEELLFRPVLIKTFSRLLKNHHAAIWVSAIIFSAFHMQFFGFLPRMFLGLVFGYLFVWSGSIWVPMLAHLLNNGSVVLVTYLYNKGFISQNPDQIGRVDSPILLIASIIMSFVIAYWFYRTRLNNSKNAFAEEPESDDHQNHPTV